MNRPGPARSAEGRFRNKNRVHVDRKAMTKRTALCLPPELPLDGWQRVGKDLFLISDASKWWLGDWLVYGQDRYPCRYRRALAETGLDYQTLRNYAWVTRKFDPSRRRAGLSFQHHAEAASLPQHDQDIWLDRAERLGWSRNLLRRHLQRLRSGADPHGDEESAVLALKIDPQRRQRWEEAAQRREQSLAEWIACELDHAAETVLSTAGEQPQAS